MDASLLSAVPLRAVRQTGEAPRTIARLSSILALSDLEVAAKRRLPKSIYGFIAGGAETGSSLSANRRSFERWSLVPRTLNDVSSRSQKTELFGMEYDAPFGIAPMGAAGLAAYEADATLAGAAVQANVPSILSGLSTTALERVIRDAPNAWFQPYVPGHSGMIAALLSRAERAGCRSIVITVDNPVPANRENNVRNGFTLPLRPSIRLAWDGISHPRWLLGTAVATLAKTGMPHFENTGGTRGVAILSRAAQRSLTDRDRLNWRHLEEIRSQWRGKLIVKGVLSAADAARLAGAGVDGIIVSNHGGRQLDCCVAPLDVLPGIVKAASNIPVMLDGGVLRGTDIIKALALGAQFVFVGRPMLYACAVGGRQGVLHAITLLKEEIDRDMALLGAVAIKDISRTHIIRSDGVQRELSPFHSTN